MRAPRGYAGYLGLPQVLDTVRPLTPRHEHVWADERLFIVCHQASELWVSQALVELERAAASAGRTAWPDARLALERTAAIVDLLCEHLRQLALLPAAAFLRFRDRLDGLSAADSEQFARLLAGRRNPDVVRMRQHLAPALAAAVHEGAGEEGACGHVECGCALKLEAVMAKLTDWRRLHVETARRLIGDRPGTGGTSGVAYLESRVHEHNHDEHEEEVPA